MKILKNVVAVFLVIAVATLAYFFFLPRSLSLPDFDKVSYSLQDQGSFTEIDKTEFTRLNDVLGKSTGALHEFYSKPEIILKFEKENKESGCISLFLKDGFLFKGEYLAAWDDRMHGFPSYCYVLSDEQKKYFADFINDKSAAKSL
jgi:hypothetical protein